MTEFELFVSAHPACQFRDGRDQTTSFGSGYLASAAKYSVSKPSINSGEWRALQFDLNTEQE